MSVKNVRLCCMCVHYVRYAIMFGMYVCYVMRVCLDGWMYACMLCEVMQAMRVCMYVVFIYVL